MECRNYNVRSIVAGFERSRKAPRMGEHFAILIRFPCPKYWLQDGRISIISGCIESSLGLARVHVAFLFVWHLDFANESKYKLSKGVGALVDISSGVTKRAAAIRCGKISRLIGKPAGTQL